MVGLKSPRPPFLVVSFVFVPFSSLKRTKEIVSFPKKHLRPDKHLCGGEKLSCTRWVPITRVSVLEHTYGTCHMQDFREFLLYSNPTVISELASEVHSTERVPQNLHEEESATAREHTVRGLKDQIVVSELTEAVPAKEIVIDKDGAEDIGKLVEQKSNEILKKVENVSAEVAKDLKDFAKDTKASAEASIMPKVETISAKVTEGLEKAFDSVDEVLKKTDEATTEAAELASRLGSAITGAIAETTATTPSPTKESATQSPAVGSPIEPPHQQIIVGETTATKT
ncbi:unnamed protein product [Haemonchus placei]|uniref:Microtubule-associated protein futsch n=1 Tax=Haemonchus placei TaxID=6290 RepID=A0A0N4VVF4_HAEPC|nr:unnamed protein product [Haemonchus placei]